MKAMKSGTNTKIAYCLTHVPFEGAGALSAMLSKRGFRNKTVARYQGDPLPPLSSVGFLLIMGGPMSIHDTDDYPWLAEEQAFVGAAMRAGIPVLGVCLGAQLMAAAAGARVYPNPHKEIGWFPIRGLPAPDAFNFPAEHPALHWHGETFDLPESAIRLAESDACRQQAFQIGRRAIGLQCHLESTITSANALIENCRDELILGSPYVQSEADIRIGTERHSARARRLLIRIVDYLTATEASDMYKPHK